MAQEDAYAFGDAPLVDRSALDPILGATGPAVMRTIVAAYWDAAQDMLDTLSAAIDSGDPESIRRAAHALKGASSNVGVGRASRIAAAMESADADEARLMFPMLEAALDDTRGALEETLSAAA